MKSKWKPGTRVRVSESVTDGTAGLVGTIEDVNYARAMPATSVLLDDQQGIFTGGFAAFYEDHELEAV